MSSVAELLGHTCQGLSQPLQHQIPGAHPVPPSPQTLCWNMLYNSENESFWTLIFLCTSSPNASGCPHKEEDLGRCDSSRIPWSPLHWSLSRHFASYPQLLPRSSHCASCTMHKHTNPAAKARMGLAATLPELCCNQHPSSPVGLSA